MHKENKMNKEFCILFGGDIKDKDEIFSQMQSIGDRIEAVWIESKHNSEPLLMSRYGLFGPADIGIFVHLCEKHHDYIFNAGAQQRAQ
jgi:hypothetical protein